VQVTYLTSPYQAFYRQVLLLFGQIPNIVCTFVRNNHHQFFLSEQHESVRALLFSLNGLIWLKTFSDVGIDFSHSDVHLQTIHIAMWVKKSNHIESTNAEITSRFCSTSIERCWNCNRDGCGVKLGVKCHFRQIKFCCCHNAASPWANQSESRTEYITLEPQSPGYITGADAVVTSFDQSCKVTLSQLDFAVCMGQPVAFGFTFKSHQTIGLLGRSVRSHSRAYDLHRIVYVQQRT